MQTRVFLDSGAFSAESQGTPVDVHEYIEFIKANEDRISVYACLDVLGLGNEGAELTWENQRIMEEAGLNPLPVFHNYEDMKYLERCIKYPYFCLGGMAGGATAEQRKEFLDRCFDIICDADGYPKTKVHLFGMAAPELLMRYPAYSFDASSWCNYGRFGMVIVPKRKRGKFVYDRPPHKVFVSERSPKKEVDGQHISNMAPAEIKAFHKYLADHGMKLGKSEIFDTPNPEYQLQENEKFINKKARVERVIESGVCNDNFDRDFLNHCFYVDLAENHTCTKFEHRGLKYLF